MKSDADRSAKYDSKTVAATQALIVAAVLPDMRTNFGDPNGMSDLVSKEQQIQGLLNNIGAPGIPTIHYPFYYAYGREIWALGRRGIAGPALTAAAQGVRDKWNYKGFLVAARLDEISLSVFNIVTS
jgi:hypothetical protein